jgi:hypothetical protein
MNLKINEDGETQKFRQKIGNLVVGIRCQAKMAHAGDIILNSLYCFENIG